jgi:hypothetical protein
MAAAVNATKTALANRFRFIGRSSPIRGMTFTSGPTIAEPP